MLLFVGCVVAVAVIVPLLIARADTQYQATALVVAQRLDINLIALPRYAEATFANGEVARALALEFVANGSPDGIVPREASLSAEQDSIILRVFGHAESAQGAADRANTAAEAFVGQLNLGGEGVGAFAVQSAALPPKEPVERVPVGLVVLAVGVAAGAVLGLAAVSVVLIARRPVLLAADATKVTGVPVLGTVTLPRMRRDRFPSAADVGGLVPVCRRLLDMQPGAILFMNAGRADGDRRHVCVAMAVLLARVRPVRLVAAPEVLAAAQALSGPDAVLVGAKDPLDPDAESGGIVLVDGPRALDVVAASWSGAAVLLVAHGTPERSLRSAVAEYLGGFASDNDRLLMLRREGRPSQAA